MASTGLFPQPLWISVRSEANLSIVVNGMRRCQSNVRVTTAPLSSSVLPIWSFLAVTVPLVLTPGASTAVVLRNSIDGGARAGIETAAGVNSGSVLYGLISAFGLAFALRRWPAVWLLLRIGGAGYLVWLGLRSIQSAIGRLCGPQRDPRHGCALAASSAAEPVRRLPDERAESVDRVLLSGRHAAVRAAAAAVRPQRPELTAIHVTIALTCHIVWAVAGGTMSRLATGWPRRLLDVGAGAAMLALAVGMAISR